VRERELVGLVWRQGLIICGLSGLAVTQPVLDLFGNNAEFFVAGNYSTSQIVAFALFVAVVPALIGVGLTTLGYLVDRRVGAAVFVGVVAVLAAAFGFALLRFVGVDAIVLVVIIAAGLAAIIVGLVLRTRSVRLFMSYLAAANLLFVGSFLFVSPTSALVVGGGTSSAADDEVIVPELSGPVVVIVLDELPAASIMGRGGTINDERYPGFAELAGLSTWFRNASGTSNWTPGAVPALLTGVVPTSDTLPTAADHPHSLYTLLGHDVAVYNYEPITSLCPVTICEPPQRAPFSRVLTDSAIVYGHRVLPSALRDSLPPIDNTWGAYGSGDDTTTSEVVVTPDEVEPTGEDLFGRWYSRSEDERSPPGQARVLADRVLQVTGAPALHVVHVAIPHFPWTLSQTGMTTSFSQARRPEDLDPDAPGFDFRARVEFQLHSMQVGAVDALLSDVLDHLQELPTWDDTTLVVTSDHGMNFTPPTLGRRQVTDDNRAEVFRVPLFIKQPGQTEGEVRDDVVQSIDVVPSLVDLLDVTVGGGWEFDGHSLYDGSEPTSPPRVSPDVAEVLAIAERRAAEFPHGDGWLGLAAVGELGDLVGRDVADLELGAPSAYTAALVDEALLDDLPTADGTMPFLLAGTVSGGSNDGPPPEMLAAVNGRVAGVIGGYRPADDGAEFVGYVADLYREGSNIVSLYEVERTDDIVVLHEVKR
jgi:Sulfatase